MPSNSQTSDLSAQSFIALFRDWQDTVAKQTGTRPSQADLASQIGTTQGAISQFLHGKTRISAEMALRLASIFAIHPSLLRPDLPYPDTMSPPPVAEQPASAVPPFVSFFRSASPYIHAHRGSTFVIHFPGEALASPFFTSLIHDIALLHTLGIRVVIVFGIRPQLSERLSRSNVNASFHGAYRVTPPEAVPALLEASGSVRTQIEALFTTSLPTSLMAGFNVRVSSGNFLTSRPIGIRDGVDYHHTGTVRRVDADAINTLLNNQTVVLIPPVGYSITGEIFNLSSYDVAGTVASKLHARKLIVLAQRGFSSGDTASLPSELSLDAARALLPSLPDAEPLSALIDAVDAGVTRGHLLDHSLDGALLTELFTRDGCGTMLSANRYETLRKANLDDLAGIISLIVPLENAGVLVRRSREQLEREIDSFLVAERDGTVLACAALHPFPREKVAELACMVVHPDYQKSGRATELLSQIERLAVARGFTHLFALTTQTAHWFLEHGFEPAEPSDLPVERQALYNYKRGSRIYRKPLRGARG